MNENVTPTGSIGERIKEVIHHYHLTMNSFSLRLKLPSNSVITRVVKDPRRGMSLDYIQRVLKEFPDISCRWFVTG